MKRLEILLLGGLAVKINNQPVTTFRSAKSRALLAYLAVYPDQDHARSTLATLLWGDLPETAAKTNLRVELSALKKVLRRAPALEISRRSVRLNSQLATIDAATFQRTVTDFEALPIESQVKTLPDLARAAALYKGEFLAGFHLRQALEYERWQRRMQERLHQQMMLALTLLQRRYAEQGDWTALAKTARRQLGLVPWQEAAHRHLMQALAAQGMRQAALDQYATCRAVLQQELGIEPAPATVALAERVENGRLSPSPVNHNVRPSLKTFIGREAEAERLLSLLPASRLVTLLGMGGVGKSTLAQKVAKTGLSTFTDGSWFIPLASIQTAEGTIERIALLIAGVVGCQITSAQSPLTELGVYLKDKRPLLILDNCEHLVTTVDEVILHLLRHTEAHILATSRQRLGLANEILVLLDGLPPEEAALLFIDRASRLLPDFAADTNNNEETKAEIEEICRQVKGMPLGIELAASWVEHFSLFEIGQSLSGIGIEPQQSATFVERHHSLTAVLKYSWRLLSKSQQQALASASVFHGGFDRAAATAVAGSSLSDLSALISHSLVQRVSAGRYDLHPLMREFGQRKRDPAQERQLLDLHSKHYLGALTAVERQQRDALLLPDFENIRQAWLQAVHEGNAPLIRQAVNQFGEFTAQFGLLSDGYKLFETAVSTFENNPDQDKLVAQLLNQQWLFSRAIYGLTASVGLLLRLLTLTTDLNLKVKTLSEIANTHAEISEWTEADAYFDQAEALAKSSSDPHVYINAVEGRIHIYAVHFRGNYHHGIVRLQEALTLLDAIPNATAETDNLRIRVRSSLQAVANRYGDYGLALWCGRQNLAWITALTHQQHKSAILLELALSEQFAGMYAEAIAHNKAALALAEEIGAEDDVGLLKANLCLTMRQSGDLEEGLAYGLAAIEPLRALDFKRMEGQARNRVGHTLLALGRWEEAYQAYKKALQLWNKLSHPNAMEAVAGCADAACRLDNMREANSCVDKVLAFTRTEGVEGIVEPALLYLHLQQALSSLGKIEDALHVLREGMRWVEKIAERISDHAVRHSFLQRPDNQLLRKQIALFQTYDRPIKGH